MNIVFKLYLCNICNRKFYNKKFLNEYIEYHIIDKETTSSNLLDDTLIQLIKENFNELYTESFKLSFNLFNENYNKKD